MFSNVQFKIWLLIFFPTMMPGLADDPPKNQPAPDATSGLVISQQLMQQKLAQAEAKRTAQRLETILKVLSYHQLDSAAEQKIMKEAATSLQSLSQDQMEQILKQFENASKSKTLVEMDKQLDQAQDKHKVVLDQIRQLLSRFELVRNVEQAALRLDKLAHEQRLLRELVVSVEQQRKTGAAPRRQSRFDSPQQHAMRQDDLARETDVVMQKLREMKVDLPDELKPRLDKVFAIANERHMLESMREAANHLRFRNPREAEDRQMQAENDLARLARTLRTPADKLGVLQEARSRVEQLLQLQSQLRQETLAEKDPRQKDSKQNQFNEKELLAARQSARQQEVLIQTRDLKELVQDITKETAAVLDQSVQAMQQAKQSLRDNQPHKALEPQTQATDKLAQARKTLDELVAAEEKAQRDPLTALQRAMEQIDKIIADQKQLQKQTNDVMQTAPSDLKPLAPKQQHLAERTEEIIAKPLAAQPTTKQLIQQAAESMHTASEQLHTQQGDPAKAQQAKAIKELQQARAALEVEAQAMKERREQIEQLEQAAKQLQDLVNKETEINKAVQNNGKENKTAQNKDTQEKLAQEQDAAKKQTDQLTKDLKQASPEASQNTSEASQQMQKASQSIRRNDSPQAAKETGEALQQLQKAQQNVSDALAKKQAEEAAAEAMQNPDKIMPAEAAVHVAKALMESQQAAKHSAQAEQDASKNSQSMKQSEAATKSAQAAIDQAKAISPENVQSSLNKARNDLEQARKNLEQQTPSQAKNNQEQASKQLTQALQSLQQTLAAMEKMQGNEQNAQNQEQQQGKEGQQGKQQAKNQSSQNKNDQSAQGDSKDKKQSGDPTQNGERDGNAKSEKNNVQGSSTFVNLPARQRELIMQALSEKLPPEHAAQIQRYFENIAGGKAASEPRKK